MARAILIAFILLLIPTSQAKLPDPLDSLGHFDSYMKGSMTIYSKFQFPSIQESERFYSYMKGSYKRCLNPVTCERAGVRAGKKYIKEMNISVEVKE